MLTIIFLILGAVALFGTFLFMLSNSELQKLNDAMNKSFGDEAIDRVAEMLNKTYNIDDKVIRYRRGVAISLFLICVFLLITGLYFIK